VGRVRQNLTSLFLAVLALGGGPDGPSGAAAAPRAETAEDLVREAFTLAYNLDHEPAMVLLRRAVALEPDNPAPHRGLASVVWLNILFQRGAVTVDHFLGSITKPTVDLSKPPPELDREFRRHVARAIELAEARIRARLRDPQAHYDLGAAVGLDASYTATVEGRLLAGFRAARRCYDAHERVLQLDPSRKEAGLIVGTYRYVVSSLSLPLRLMAYVAGFGGGRERGLQMVEEAAAHPGDARTDARFALILMYNREKRYADALRVIGELQRQFPRNRLMWLEAGSTALRAGRAAQAADLLNDGLEMLAKDDRPRIPGEEALWKYKRGAARAAMGRSEEARADLRLASSAGQGWVRGRAHLELGKLSARAGDRPAARAAFGRALDLCQSHNDKACVEDAKALLRKT
jgi:tetratricopeptide (TPR) repeat protein